MQLKKLFILLLLFFFSNTLFSSTKSVTPSTVQVRESFVVAIDTDAELLSSYDVRIKISGYSGELALGGGPRYWNKTLNLTKSNDYTFEFLLYQNDDYVSSYGTSSVSVQLDGSCGTADNHNYPANTSSYGSYTQCSSGAPDSTNFSVLSNNDVEWHCLGENGGDDPLCVATVEETLTPIDGECGTASSHIFEATDTGYGSYTQCKIGNSDNTRFPNEGSTEDWHCSGTDGGNADFCEAGRKEKIDGSCGTADGHKYPANTTSYGSYTQCNSGTPDSTNFSVLSNNEVEWHCLGENGGNDPLCVATVEEAPIVKPNISRISPNPIITKDGDQNVYLNGSNFKSTNVVEWENGNDSGTMGDGTGFHFESDTQIRLYMNTTLDGTGTWRFRVKDGSNYSDWKEVEAEEEVPNNQTPTKPTIYSVAEFTKDKATTIAVNSGTDTDSDKVKISCSATNSNYTTSSPYLSALDVGGHGFNVSFTFDVLNSQTISCKSIDEHGFESAIETAIVDVVEDLSNDILLGSLYTLPNPAKINTDVTFYAEISRDLENNEKAYILIDGASTENLMHCVNKECTYPQLITRTGENRKFTVFIKDGNSEIVQKDGFYTMIEAKTSYQVIKFWISDTDKYYAEDSPNFDTQFSVVNDGNEDVTFNKMAITILNEDGSYKQDCWINNSDTVVQSNTTFNTGIKYCNIDKKGNYKAVAKLYKNGKWEEYGVQSFYLKGLIDDNVHPTLSVASTSSNELKEGDSFTLYLEAEDNDGLVKRVDIDWNDDSAVETIETNSEYVEVNKTHTFNNHGTYTWTSRAYDNWASQDTSLGQKDSRSQMKSGKVYVYDEEYFKTPTLSPINNSEIKATHTPQFLILEGTNFSNFSTVKWINNNSSGDAHGTMASSYISSTRIQIDFVTSIYGDGTWTFNVVNKGGISNAQSITVKATNKAPIMASGTDTINLEIVSGTKIELKMTAKDNNLESINYTYNGGKAIPNPATSSVSKTFTFTPTYSGSDNYGTDTIKMWAVDTEGVSSTPIYVTIKVYTIKHSYVFVNDANIEEAGQCGGTYTIKNNGSINTASGAEMFSLNLMKVQGLHSISSVLSYNSLLLTDNSISRGWNHNYGFSASLEFLDIDKQRIRLNWQDGNHNDFNLTSPNTYTSTNTVTKFSEIIKNSDGTFTLNLPNKIVYQFYEDGFIKAVENQLGQGINVGYDSNGSLRRVSDGLSGVALEYAYNAEGKLSKIIDPQLNRETLLTYNDKGYLSKIETPANIVYYFDYNDIGQITQFSYGDGTIYFKNTYLENGLIETEDDGRDDNHIFEYSFDRSVDGFINSSYIDGEGESTTYLYDDKDFLLYKITDALGNEINNEYNQTTRQLIKTTNAKNESTIFAYDSRGRMSRQLFANGLVKEFVYDARDNLISEKSLLSDATSYTTAYSYDINNTLQSKILANGDSYGYRYNSDMQLIEATSPSGAKTAYAYEKGRVTTVTYPKGNSLGYAYDEAGRVISQTLLPLDATTQYSYDEADRVIETTDALGHTTRYGYDMRGNKRYSKDANNNITHYEYDSKNNLLKIIYADSTETTYDYDGEDRVKTITYANSATNTFEYDPLGRVTKQIDAMGNFIEFKYDALGNVLQKFDSEGNLIVAYKYDTMQQVVEAVDYFNNKVTSSYNQLGMLEQTTDPLDRVNTFKYDKLGRLTEAVDALNGLSTKSYDIQGNTKDFTDPNNNKTELKHDEVGNLTEITTASESSTKYEYDKNSLLIKETNAKGQERTYNYNKNAQILSIVDEVATIIYSYDDNGNTLSIDENSKKTSMVYNEMNQLTSYTDQEGNTLGYSYDSVGNLSTLTYPDSKTVEYAYNLANQLTSVKDWNNNVTSYAYDNHGRMLTQTYPNGAVLTRTYDNGSRLIAQKEVLADGTRISEVAYEYDKVGNILKERTYPQISPKALASLQMSYAKGNLLAEANQTIPLFDKEDNMLEYGALSLTYDSRNRLTQANSVKYSYDSQNNRVSKSTNDSNTSYITNPNASLSQLLVQTKGDGTKSYFVYGLGLISQTKGTQTLYYHYDLRGSTLALSDTTGYITDKFSYALYGKLLTHSGTTKTPFLFVGKHGVMQEENELIYMRARYYHQTLRRFVNRDTLMGEVGDFGSLNRFGYVKGMTSGDIDPHGLSQYRSYGKGSIDDVGNKSIEYQDDEYQDHEQFYMLGIGAFSDVLTWGATYANYKENDYLQYKRLIEGGAYDDNFLFAAHYKYAAGTTINLDMNTMYQKSYALKNLKIEDFNTDKAISNGKGGDPEIYIALALSKYSKLIYGDVTVAYNNKNGMYIKDDIYNFDFKSEQGFSYRNVGTVCAKILHGNGTPFKIRFNGYKVLED